MTVTETNQAILSLKSRVFEGMFTDPDILKTSIPARLRYQMKRAGLSQPALAKRIGCSRDTVHAYACGKTSEGNMNIDLLKQMAKEMELPEYYFCNEYHIFIENTDVSTFLQEMRLGLGLNQRKFAEKVDIPLDAYKTYEQGKIRIPMRYWKKIMDWKEKLNLESGSEAKMN